jgi:DNA-binding transcriptional LysR family regulator
MDWSLFVHFRTVARLNHLGRAAEELGITQPTLSRTIRALEARYELPLFDRHGRTVRLNDNGRVLLEHVERALQGLEDADRAMRDRAATSAGGVAVGFIGTLGSRTIPAIARSFSATHPAVVLRLFQGAQPDLLERLSDGRLDIAFTSAGEGDAVFAWQHLWDEELFVHVYPAHRFAARADVQLEELRDEPLVALRSGTALRAITDTLLVDACVEPRVVCEGQNIVTVRGLVAAGLGIMLGPMLEDVPADRVVSVRVAKTRCVRPVGLSWLKGRYLSTAAQRFREAVSATSEQRPPLRASQPEASPARRRRA